MAATVQGSSIYLPTQRQSHHCQWEHPPLQTDSHHLQQTRLPVSLPHPRFHCLLHPAGGLEVSSRWQSHRQDLHHACLTTTFNANLHWLLPMLLMRFAKTILLVLCWKLTAMPPLSHHHRGKCMQVNSNIRARQSFFGCSLNCH